MLDNNETWNFLYNESVIPYKDFSHMYCLRMEHGRSFHLPTKVVIYISTQASLRWLGSPGAQFLEVRGDLSETHCHLLFLVRSNNPIQALRTFPVNTKEKYNVYLNFTTMNNVHCISYRKYWKYSKILCMQMNQATLENRQ